VKDFVFVRRILEVGVGDAGVQNRRGGASQKHCGCCHGCKEVVGEMITEKRREEKEEEHSLTHASER